MATIEGKQVVFRDKLPPALVWSILPAVYRVKTGDNIYEKIPFDKAVLMVQCVVESWGFEGDPHTDEWYNALTEHSLANVFMPLVAAAYSQLVVRINEEPGLGE